VRPLRHLICIALSAVLLSACSSSSPDGPEVPPESAFAEGTCRTAAPEVRAVGEAIPRLGEEGEVDAEVKESLRESQGRLRAVADGAESELKPVLDDLIQKIGIVRIRADGNTYEPQFGESLTRSYEQVVASCTDSGASN
jgi:hypothetical protein